jgi:SOS response regulatory protein OraA/RecX
MGYIDDQKFADWLVESRSRSRPRGNRLLAAELKAKGIDPATINDSLLTSSDQVDSAVLALSKKERLWSNLPAREFRFKASRYLASRGFSWDTIEQALKKRYNDEHVS